MTKRDTYAIRAALSSRDLAILQDLKRFRLLSTRHIQRLHFRYPTDHTTIVGATRATHRVLQRLLLAGLIGQLARRVGGLERGSASALWQLGERGAEVLALGVSEPRRARYREPATSLFVNHTVAIAESAVTLTEYVEQMGLEILTLQTEPDAWRAFLGVNGEAESLRPDLYVVIANATFEQHAFVEIDMATEHGPQILRKCHLYARFAANGAAECQAGVVPRVIWVAAAGGRREALRRMIASDRTLPVGMFTIVSPEHLAANIAAGLDEEPG